MSHRNPCFINDQLHKESAMTHIQTIIHLLRDSDRPAECVKLMDDAAMALTRMEIAIKAFLREYNEACVNDTHTMRLGELADMMREAL